jgi:tetratricopeptide (TPR) repeat protein
MFSNKTICAIFAASVLLPATAFAQDEDLSKLLSESSSKSDSEITTGINGAIPMDTIVKAMEQVQKNMGSDLKASDSDYSAASKIIAGQSDCTSKSCVISGSDQFLGAGTNLDASIDMVDKANGEKGLVINLKLLDAKTGKVIKTVSEPFDPESQTSLNSASMSAAKAILADNSAQNRTAAGSAKTSATGSSSKTASAHDQYLAHYSAGTKLLDAGSYSQAAEEFMKAYEIKPTKQAKKKMNEALDKMPESAR